MKRVWTFYLLSIILIISCESGAFAQINGRIIYDGVYRPLVKITAYENSEEGKTRVAATAEANASGYYQLDLPKGKSFKVVYQYDSKEYEPDRFTPLVRFVNSPSNNVDLNLRSILNSAAPFLVSSVYKSGKGNDSTFTLLALSSEDTCDR